ncbi:MAG: hypothetical protein HYR55_07090 [Acidobacteria bacterium]|nr:hypothetical protein [Acidobacteriota bacterium]MBI3656212.1 hypothetical protein [Acidobacteriota bacterium]
MSTIKVLSSTLFFSLTWLALAWAMAKMIGGLAPLVALLTCPLLAFAALVFFERVNAVAAAARAFLAFILRRSTYDRLRQERQAIHDEIIALARLIANQ